MQHEISRYNVLTRTQENVGADSWGAFVALLQCLVTMGEMSIGQAVSYVNYGPERDNCGEHNPVQCF